MGLSTTHNCWNGAYSAFNAWRDRIAIAAGYGRLFDRDGFGGDKPWPVPPFCPTDREGMAAAAAVDPLLVLLMHSDCEGVIPSELCNAIADKLEEFPAGAKFARGLRLAAKRGEDVEFH